MNDLKWFQINGAWHFQCQADVKISECRWVQQGDLVILSLERGGESASLQGILHEIKAKKQNRSEADRKSFIVEVELSRIAELTWNAQEAFLKGASNWRLDFISIPPNEKKSIQLLQDMPRSCPLQSMRLTFPRSTREMKREMEMRPLVTVEEVRTGPKSVKMF